MKTCFYGLSIGVFAVAAIMGQGAADSRRPIRGEITPATAGISRVTVELSPAGGGPTESAAVNSDGTFETAPLDTGAYEVRVVGPDGAVLYRETTIISASRLVLSIRLPQPSTVVSSSVGDTVSAHQLLYKAPPQARKAFEKGQQAEAKGDRQQAIEHFRQAVAIDPKFADAFNEMGAMEAAQGHFGPAIEDFQKAIDVAPAHHLALANLSIVLAKAQRYDEAAVAARRALQFMPGSGTIHYILATSLFLSKGESDEVLDNLERSAGDVPYAHLLAAEILAHRGRREDAVKHLENFLQAAAPNDKQRVRAEAMLARLRS